MPVAISRTSFSDGRENVNFPFGPMNSNSSPSRREFSQLLPRPFGMILMMKSKFLFCGGEAMEYARRHAPSCPSAIFIVINCPASKEKSSSVLTINSKTSSVRFL